MTQELIARVQQLYEESQEIENRHADIMQHIAELEEFRSSLASLPDVHNRDIITPIGRGVYVPAKMTENHFLINVGAGILVQKTREEAIGIIGQQIERLTIIRQEMEETLLELSEQLQELMGSVQNVH